MFNTISNIIIAIIFISLLLSVPIYLYSSGPLSGLEKIKNEDDKAYFSKVLGDGKENDYFFNIPKNELGAFFIGYHIVSIKKISNQNELQDSPCKNLITKLPDYELVLQPKTLFGITWTNWVWPYSAWPAYVSYWHANVN